MQWNRRQAIKAGVMAGFAAAFADAPYALGGTPAAGLAQLGDPHGMKVGIQCGTGRFAQPVLGPFLRSNFNMVTPPLKWTSLRPSPDRYDFTEADQQFADQKLYKLAVHGHNLCWSTSNPAWFDSVLTKQNAREYLTGHINTVAGRYRGRVDSWDVVNEPIAVWNHRPDGLTQGPWLTLLGPEYIDIAFHAAQAADPSALRTLNLNGCESPTTGEATRTASLNLVKELQRRGVPVQAVAVEAHIDGPWKPNNTAYINFLRALHDTGVEVYVTEMDVNDTAIAGSDPQVEEAVAQTYAAYLTDVLSAVRLKRLIFWSMSDKFDWYGALAETNPRWRRADNRPHHLGLTDTNFMPNAAYSAVRGVLEKL